jgi:methionyl-tRNA formyltransferase
MMGTGPFAVPTFLELLESQHEVAALVTRPARPVHRKGKPPLNPMHEAAEARGIAVMDPENVNDEQSREALADCQPDLLVVCDYGQILTAETLSVARLGGVNLHASLLPKYRGAAPIAWAIYHGETETGNTVIHMTPRLDAGPCIAQCRVPIDPEETAGQLEDRLAQLGAPLVLEAIAHLESDTVEPIVQDQRLATRAPRLKKSDGQVDWSRAAHQIKNQVRALDPWPRTFTDWQRPDREPLRLLLHEVRVESTNQSAGPGTVLEAEEGNLRIATGQGVLSLIAVQPSGKRVLTTEEFLRGYPVQPGDQMA